MVVKRFDRFEIIGGGVLLAAILLKVILQRYHLHIEGDRAFQLAATLNLANGHGYTIAETSLPLLDKMEYRWVVEWPVLYSALMAPILWITGMNQVLSMTIMDALSAIFFLTGIYKLLRSIGLPLHVVLIVVLFQASVDIFLYATDFPAAACVIWATYFFCKTDSEKTIRHIYISSLLLCAAMYMRFMYAPLLLLNPLFLLCWSIQEKNFRLLKHALLVALLSILMGSAGYIANKLLAGQLSYLHKVPVEFNILRAFRLAPIFWHAFTHVLFVTVQLSIRLHTEYSTIFGFLVKSSLLAMAVLTGLFARFAIRMRKISFWQPYDRFIIFGSAASGLVLLSMMFLSARLNYSANKAANDGWTFVNEQRYFMIPVFMILTVITSYVFSHSSKWNWTFALRSLIIAALIIQVMHAVWILHKFERMPTFAEIKMNPYRHKVSYIMKSVHDAALKNGFDMVALTSHYRNVYYCQENKIKIFRHLNQLDGNTEIMVSHPTILTIVATPEESDEMKAFMKKYGFIKLVALTEDASYYFTAVKPTK